MYQAEGTHLCKGPVVEGGGGGRMSSEFQIWTSIAREKNRPAVPSLVGLKRAFSGLNSGGSTDGC